MPERFKVRKRRCYDCRFECVPVIENIAPEWLVINCQFNKLFSLSFMYMVQYFISQTQIQCVTRLLKSFLDCFQNDIQAPRRSFSIFLARSLSTTMHSFPWPWAHTPHYHLSHQPLVLFNIFLCLSAFVCCSLYLVCDTHTLFPLPWPQLKAKYF